MGPWDKIVDQLIDALVLACSDFELEQKSESYKLNLNTANIIAVVGRFSDFYGLTTPAFTNVNWSGSSINSSSLV